jgi:hypothetical protein
LGNSQPQENGEFINEDEIEQVEDINGKSNYILNYLIINIDI